MKIKRQTRLIILVLFISMLFYGAALIKEQLKLSEEMVIERPEFGQGSEKYSLYVKGRGEAFENDYSISFEVQEATPSEEELETYFSNIIDYAFEVVLGNNKSCDYITESLNFIKKIPETRAEIEWVLDDYSFFKRNGERNDAVVPEGGKEIRLTCIVSYKGNEAERTRCLRLMPKEEAKEEKLLGEIRESLSELEEDKESRYFELPKEIGDIYLEWSTKESRNPIMFLILGILTAVTIPLFCKKEEEKLIEKRNLQMQIDYPYIVDKFLILLNAGMTIRTAWERIVRDYEAQKRRGITRPAYEEMLYTRNELAAGLPEEAAYEAFGKRCALLPYLRFATLISQNLRKGSRGILPLLELEAKNAFADRKQTARRLGEEAGTKLVFPMIGFLVIVMLIVLVPALQMI